MALDQDRRKMTVPIMFVEIGQAEKLEPTYSAFQLLWFNDFCETVGPIRDAKASSNGLGKVLNRTFSTCQHRWTTWA